MAQVLREIDIDLLLLNQLHVFFRVWDATKIYSSFKLLNCATGMTAREAIAAGHHTLLCRHMVDTRRKDSEFADVFPPCADMTFSGSK